MFSVMSKESDRHSPPLGNAVRAQLSHEDCGGHKN